jgi:hypothetical protein
MALRRGTDHQLPRRLPASGVKPRSPRRACAVPANVGVVDVDVNDRKGDLVAADARPI